MVHRAKKSKIWIWKRFLQVDEHIVVGKTMENEREHRDIKLVKGIIWFQNQTIIQQNFPLENLLAIEMKKKKKQYSWINQFI